MSKKFNNDTKLFSHRDGLVRYSPALAQEIGEKESLLLLQFEYWLVALEGEERDGEKWIYKSMGEMEQRFPSWSHKTIFRILKSLEDNKYISSRSDMNKRKGDQTKWYTLNFEVLSSLRSFTIERTLPQGGANLAIPVGQKAQKEDILTIPVGQKELTIPETPTEITENSSEKENPIFLLKIPYPQIGNKTEEDICFLEEKDIPTLFHCLHSPASPPPLPPSPEEASREWKRKVFAFAVRTIYKRYSKIAPTFSLAKWHSLLSVELCDWRKLSWEKWGNIPSLSPPPSHLTSREKFSMLEETIKTHRGLYGATY